MAFRMFHFEDIPVEIIAQKLACDDKTVYRYIAEIEIRLFDSACTYVSHKHHCATADKINHDAYYERVLRLVRAGGIIVFDNVFWDAYVIDPLQTDPDTEAVRALNHKIHEDLRVTISTIPLSDGLTIALRR